MEAMPQAMPTMALPNMAAITQHPVIHLMSVHQAAVEVRDTPLIILAEHWQVIFRDLIICEKLH